MTGTYAVAMDAKLHALGEGTAQRIEALFQDKAALQVDCSPAALECGGQAAS